MTTSAHAYPLSAVRALALHAQGLDRAASAAAVTPGDIYDTVERLGAVQIDTLQRVQRSQYVALWSRLGQYDPADFDRLIYQSEERRLFEYWWRWNAACIIPLREFRFVLPTMRFYVEDGGNWTKKWLLKDGSAEIVEEVHKRVKREGGLRAAHFEDERAQRGTWWDWKPAKRALEYLYDRGDLMIAERVNFQRVYDLRERVLPDWVDASEPPKEEAVRFRLERAVRALGVCLPEQAGDYTQIKRTEARPFVEALVAEGIFVGIEASLSDGSTREVVVHRDDLPLLEQAADGGLPAQRTTFLSPFDNLFWARGRDQQFWNFRQVLEAYKPADKREWGYFCLPILHRDALVGRFDPKLERKTGLLRLEALYLEPGVKPGEQLVGEVAKAMRDFMAFHDATDLVIERSQPAAFGKKLLGAL